MFEENTSEIEYSAEWSKKDIEQARNYENDRYSKPTRGRRLDRIDKAFARKLYSMVGSNAHIVDIPCGTGRFFEIFSKAAKLTMIDYSESMLKVAKERHEIPENVTMLQGDIASLPLSDNSADLCFCMRFFHHLDNDKITLKVLKELSRISRKYVAISFYNRNCLRYYRKKLRGKKIRAYYFSFSHIVELAKQAGLEVIEKQPKFNFIETQCLVIFKKV